MTALKPWYAVATPHEDIRKGRFEEAVFAANIWAVVQRTAPEVYRDPEEFFRKTYMTSGLETILKRVAAGLKGGEAGDRILSLQTSFGGGKTHSLVALWHLAKHAEKLRKSPDGEALRKALGKHFPERGCSVAVFTNATCDATQGRQTPEGVHTRTLWGELALQLGKKSLYEIIRANDETQRVPQGIFVEVLRKAAPCLILLDELADYCVGAAAVAVAETTLADQTVSFVQQLEEAVAQVPGCVVVATLPASRLEVAQSEKGQELFSALEKRFQRLGADVKPVADDEIYSVVRARLFESITSKGESDYPSKVARAYADMYAEHASELPSEASKAGYREAIEHAYPFHPSVIDTLHTRWGGHPDFQRTRGVLRLLASIVGDLWKRRDGNTETQTLIQPCHVRWTIDALQASLTRLWGPAYESVAAADVVGSKANSTLLDEEREGDYQRERIGEGIAAAILLGSFGGQGSKSGFSAKDLKLVCSRPGLNWNYTDGALLELENRCFFLHTTAAGSLGKRYWFATKPTLNKLVVQYRGENPRKNFDDEILQSLRENTQQASGAATWRVVVDPGDDLPEQRSLTLVMLPPSLPWNGDQATQDAVKARVMQLSSRCGGRDRLYRNTLLFLAANARGLSKLRTSIRERVALESVKQDYSAQLDDEQKDDLKKRLEHAEKAAGEAVGPAYTVVLRVSGTQVEAIQLPDARPKLHDHLAYLWGALMDDEEWILRRAGSVTLKKAGLIVEDSGLRVKDAVDAFLRFTDKPMIASKDAVLAGLTQACKDGLIAIGRGPTVNNLQSRYCREAVALDPNEEGLWIIPPFEPSGAAKPDDEVTRKGDLDRETPRPPDQDGLLPPTEDPVEGGQPKVVRRIVIRGAVPQESWSDVFRAFVGPAARLQVPRLRLGIDFELEWSGQGALPADHPSIKSMEEAARQLGLDIDLEN